MIIFTSICTNYAHKARTLAQSVKQHIPYAKFFVCLTERGIPISLQNDDRFDRVVLSKDMWDGNFDRFIFKHAIVEASTAVKGRFFCWLFEQYPDEDCFVYLDPDCYVYDDFVELKEELKKKSIVLCPHLLHPGNIDMELSSTAHGVYNLGFLAVANDAVGLEMVKWWADRLYLFCYDDIANGVFTDQKWVDLAPCFFDVKILRHYGYDFAPWGLYGCKVEKKDGKFFVQDQPVRFVHYSGYGAVAKQCMEKWQGENAAAFTEMYDAYCVQHEKNNEDQISKMPWSYSTYHDGKEIATEVRRRYRTDWDLMFLNEDPFALNDQYFQNYFVQKDKAAKKSNCAYIKEKLGNVKRIYNEGGMRAVARRSVQKIRERFVNT